MNTTIMMQLGLCLIVMLVVVHVRASSTVATTPAPSATTPAPGATTPAPGATTPAQGSGGNTAATFTGSGYMLTLTASIMAFLYQLL